MPGRGHIRLVVLSSILSFLVLLPLVRLSSQRSTVGTIVGRILGPGGTPITERVHVELQIRGATMKSTYADDSGTFAFYELGYNAYRVVVRKEGYQPVSQLVVVRPDVTSVTTVRVVLIPLPEETRPAPAETPPGSNPYLVDLAAYARQFPPHAIKEFEAGVKAEGNGQMEAAVTHYEAAIRLAPDFYPAHNNLGSTYLSRGEFEAAEQEFLKVIELNHADPQAYLNLGNVFFLTGRFHEAERTLWEGLKREPTSSLGHFLLGCVYAGGGEVAKAERHLRRAVELDASLAKAHLVLANLYLQWGRAVEAVAVLKQFSTQFPTHPFLPNIRERLRELENSEASDR